MTSLRDANKTIALLFEKCNDPRTPVVHYFAVDVQPQTLKPQLLPGLGRLALRFRRVRSRSLGSIETGLAGFFAAAAAFPFGGSGRLLMSSSSSSSSFGAVGGFVEAPAAGAVDVGAPEGRLATRSVAVRGGGSLGFTPEIANGIGNSWGSDGF